MRFRRAITVLGLAFVLALTWYPTSAKAQAIKDGLVGHWTFDEKDTDAKIATDALGEHDGEIMGAPELVEGKVGEALRFDGEEDYIVMGAVTEGLDLTYAVWIKVEALPVEPKVILWDDDPQGGGDSWMELLADGTVQTQRGGDGFGVFKTTTPVVPGEWTHITFVSDEKNEKKILYINGEADAEAAGTVNNRNTRSHVVVAVGHDRNRLIKPFYFQGDIDDVAIYLRALSAEEVKKNIEEAAAVDSAGKLTTTWGAIKTSS